MANAYGSEEYDKYIKDYDQYKFDKSDEIKCTFNGLDAVIEYFDCSFEKFGIKNYREKTILTLVDSNGVKHIYECFETFMFPFEFKYNGASYIVFRKTLYGYTLLNLDNFEEINYFPSDVLEGEEAFIICEVKIINDILIFGGCYWGGVYRCYALDLKTLKVIDLSQINNISDIADNGIAVINNLLVLTESNNKIHKIEYDKLAYLIKINKNKDL